MSNKKPTPGSDIAVSVTNPSLTSFSIAAVRSVKVLAATALSIALFIYAVCITSKVCNIVTLI